MSNLSSDYEGVIREGLLARRESVDAYGQRIIDALLGLTDRYRAEALRQGKQIWPPFWNMYRVMALSILGRPFKVFEFSTSVYGWRGIITILSAALTKQCILI